MHFFGKQSYKQFVKMNTEELSGLNDNALFQAVTVRTENKVGEYKDWAKGVDSLNENQKVFYCVNWLDVEVNNGGLCQFFVNSSRMAAPLISGYLGLIGANEHKKLFDDFVEKNKIDLTELSDFDADDWSEFEEKYDLYQFDDFDNAYYSLEPLELYLTKFAKEHLSDF